jgi:flagellar motor protein MotB
VKQISLLYTPSVENKVKDFSRILRPRFDSLSAKLKPQDLDELEDLAQSLRGQDIRRIHIIGHTDNKPIRARSRHLFTDNEALSRARAKSVGDYLQKSLGLSDEQINISGMADKKQLLYSEMLSTKDLFSDDQLSLNRRVEVLG